MSEPTKESGEVLDGEDARVLANTLRMANETSERLLVEREMLRDAIERAIVIAERTDIKPLGRLGAVHATLRLALRERPEGRAE